MDARLLRREFAAIALTLLAVFLGGALIFQRRGELVVNPEIADTTNGLLVENAATSVASRNTSAKARAAFKAAVVVVTGIGVARPGTVQLALSEIQANAGSSNHLPVLP